MTGPTMAGRGDPAPHLCSISVICEPTAAVLSSLVLAWSAHPQRLALSSASATLFLSKICFLQSSSINPTWLVSRLEERPMATAVSQCAGREMLSMEYLGC